MDKPKRLVLAVTAVLLCAGARARPALGQTWSGDVNAVLAGKHLDTADWEPAQDEGELGLQTSWQGPGWPIALAADFLAARKDADIASRGFTEQRSRTTEADLGVRKIWETAPHVRPYLGGGLAVVSGRLEFAGPGGTISDEDSGAGLWLGGGVSFLLSRAFNLGVDAKISHGDVRLFGVNRNAGGFHLGLLLGYHWGS